ncbi:Hypothetical_protein [Hexamita inflata]|uniref:Hypothetical_protein n=1 Tax=Hexamita inflata TaxID=28002 RepID=A0AA86PAI9_9EUKA|nr:Hypothetical protein HINF_LOCUS22797 [Hexamita inflata]
MCVSGELINLTDTALQYRFSSQYSAGLVINVSQQLIFDLSNVKLLGYNYIITQNALLVYYSNIQITINISNVQVCSNSLQNTLQLSSSLIVKCEKICENEDVFVYGICADTLINGQMQNYSLSCVDPFIFNGSQCICKEQFILNRTECVEVIFQLNQLLSYNQVNQQQINSNTESINKIKQDMNDVENNITQNLNSVIQMIQQQEQFMFGNMNALNSSIHNIDLNLQNNASMLISTIAEIDKRIQNNTTLLYNALQNNSSNLVQLINNSNTQLSTIILNLNSSINNKIYDINQSVQQLNQNLLSNISETKNTLNYIFNTTEQHIFGNITLYDNKLQYNTSILDQRIFNNATIVYAALAANISLKDYQIQQLSDQLLLLQGLVMNTKEYALQFQSYVIYTFKLFDITKVTNSIQSSDFSSGSLRLVYKLYKIHIQMYYLLVLVLRCSKHKIHLLTSKFNQKTFLSVPLVL